MTFFFLIPYQNEDIKANDIFFSLIFERVKVLPQRINSNLYKVEKWGGEEERKNDEQRSVVVVVGGDDVAKQDSLLQRLSQHFLGVFFLCFTSSAN